MLGLGIYDQATFSSVLNWQSSTFVRVGWPRIGDALSGRMFDAKPDALHVVLVDGNLRYSYASTLC